MMRESPWRMALGLAGPGRTMLVLALMLFVGLTEGLGLLTGTDLPVSPS